MKLPSWISVIGVVTAEAPCAGTTEASCLTGKACSWENNSCGVKIESVSSGMAYQMVVDVMIDMEPQKAKSAALDATNNLGIIGLQLMQDSDLFNGLDLKSWLPYSQQNYMTGMMSPGGFFGNQLADQYFSCPIDVPFCARKACTAHFDNEANAYTCYSEPGCCFDQNLYLHKQMFGETFYQHVPVCYRAIDNPLFNQLAEEVTKQGNQFNPSYVGPIVNKVASFMLNPFTSSALENYMQCAPQEKSFQSYEFLNKLQAKFPAQAQTINMMMLAGQDNYFSDLVSVLTPSFGWTNINKHECVLAGGCWSGTKCQSPLKLNDITEEQLNSAIQHINFLKFVDKTASTTEAKSLSLKEMLAVQAMNAGNQNNPGIAGLFSGMDMNKLLKYKYLMGGNTAATLPGLATYAMMNNQAIDFNNVGQNNLSGLANLAYLTSQNDSGDLMQSMVNNWAAQSLGLDANTLWLIQGHDASTAPFASSASDAGLGIPTASNDMFASSKLADYFKTQALLGGKMEFGAMFGNNQQSTCPAEEVSVNCMPPSSSSFTDFLGIHKEKALCQAKGCCWDQSRQNNNAFGLTRYTCSWNPEWSIYNKFSFLPSLTQSLRGCCALSACVQPEGRATQHNIPAAPVAVVEAAPVVNDSASVGAPVAAPVAVPVITAPVHNTKYGEWEETSCTVSCGGGVFTKYRDCISGCDALRFKRQFKHNNPCNQHACEYGLPLGSLGKIIGGK